MSENTEVTWKK